MKDNNFVIKSIFILESKMPECIIRIILSNEINEINHTY